MDTFEYQLNIEIIVKNINIFIGCFIIIYKFDIYLNLMITL